MQQCDFSCDSDKKLTQTKIYSFFSGCVKILPTPEKTKGRRKRPPISRRNSVFSVSFETNERNAMSAFNGSSPPRKSLDFSFTKKRKLPAPIFSDDEFSEDENSPVNLNTSVASSPSKPKVMIICNKPGPLITSPTKTTTTFDPTLVSTPTTNQKKVVDGEPTPCCSKTLKKEVKSKSNKPCSTPTASKKKVDKEEPTPCCSKTLDNMSTQNVKIIENVVISPSKQHTPKKDDSNSTVKTEGKKINYDYLKAMREFFKNVLDNRHLKMLLSASDQEFLMNFFNINDINYQYTCVKLLLWKPIWYNIFKYMEQISLTMEEHEVVKLYNCLKDNNFIETDYLVEDTFSLLQLLSVKELRWICKSFKFPNPAKETKDEIISHLLKNCKTQVTLTSKMNTEGVLRKRITEQLGYCFKLSTRLRNCLYSVFLLNTFTNTSLSTPQDYFLNVTYLNTVFPSYDIENYNIFYTPDEFTKFAIATQMRCELDLAMEKKMWAHVFEICKRAFTKVQEIQELEGTEFDEARLPYLEHFTACSRYISIVSAGSKHLPITYRKDIKLWFEYFITQCFSQYKRGEWYGQLLLIYSVEDREFEKAAKMLIRVLENEKDNLSEVQLHELACRGKLLNKKSYNLPQLYHDKIVELSPPSCDRNWPEEIVDSKVKSCNQPGQRKRYEHELNNGDIIYYTVEEKALEHYKSLGYTHGVHCEGSLIRAAFCLLFWDIIYGNYVKGVFISPMQSAPLDMYSKYFYQNRQEHIDKRIAKIESKWPQEKLKKFFYQRWNEHSHETSLCQIDAIASNCDFLFNCIMCIGRPVIAKMFERLVKNFRVYHSGFPDLIVWNVERKTAKFVEIKSENDKLSIKQKLWLNFLMDIKANVEVCHVLTKGSKKKLLNLKKKEV